MINYNTDIKSHEGPRCKISDRTKYSFLEFDFFPKYHCDFEAYLKNRQVWLKFISQKRHSLTCKIVSYSAIVLNLIKGVGTGHPPPPHVFGKPKYPIVNNYKSWFSSTHASRNRSKFWNQCWVRYPSCYPPFRINISFLKFCQLFVLLWCWYMYLN